MRSRLLALIASLCLAGGLLGVTAGAALAAPVCGAHCYTNGATGSDVTGDGTAGNPYATINKSLTDVTAGGIVTVANTSTYPEFVDITKSVILEGANSGVTCRGVRGTETVVTGTTFGAFRINANDVTINGFQISDPNDTANLNSGIWMNAANKGAHITNNLISNNPEGIYANSAGASLIDCNIFDSNNVPAASGGTGIYSEFTDHLTIDRNEFKNHNINNPVIFGATAADVHKSLTFSNNWLHDNYSGVYSISIATGWFTGNTITAVGGTALSFTGGNHDVSVMKNILDGSDRGVRFRDDGYGHGPDHDFLVNRNSLAGNSDFAICVALPLSGPPSCDPGAGSYTGLVNGECNWYGDASGPGPVGPGTGSKVTAGVDYTPWLVTSNLDGPCGPDLTIAKTHTPATFRQGDTSDFYTITVTNVGGGPTAGLVTVTDFPPPFFTPTAMSGTGWSCTVSTRTCTRSDALAPFVSYDDITLTGSVGTGPASGTNTAKVSGGGDVNAANNTANDPTSVSGIADLTVTKTHTGSGRVWTLVRFTITVSNSGNGPTVGTVDVWDVLPSGLFAISMSGTGWTCIPFTGHCFRSSPSLVAGSSYPPITVRAFITWGSSSLVTNTVTVSGGGESNFANDSATDGLIIYHWLTW